jgi:riboflavin synthase
VFTGIVEAVGRIREREPLGGGLRFVIESELASSLSAGDSIAVNGVCLTVTDLHADALVAEAVGTTLSRTTLAALQDDSRVNLERPLALGARLGGHLVQGHVDGVGHVLAIEARGEHVLIDIRVPVDIARATVLHGSIAVDGVSMTVNALPGPDTVQLSVVPFTWEHTTFSRLEAGSPVNLEADMIGKYVAAYLDRLSSEGGLEAARAGKERT